MRDALSIESTKGSASIGWVISSFFLIIFVIFPLLAMAIEMKAYDIHKQKVVLASELAAIDMVMDLSPELLSEGTLFWHSDLNEVYEINLSQNLDHLTCEIDPKNISVTWNPDVGIPALDIGYSYVYKGQWIQSPQLSKEMVVEFKYELPMDY